MEKFNRTGYEEPTIVKANEFAADREAKYVYL